MKDIQTKQYERITAFETRMDTIKSKTSTEISSGVENTKKDIIKSIKGNVGKLVDKRHREMRDRRRKKRYVVFFNLVEHSYSSGAENKHADERDVH